MHIIQNYTLKKNVVTNFLPLVMALLQLVAGLLRPRLFPFGKLSKAKVSGTEAVNLVGFHFNLYLKSYFYCEYLLDHLFLYSDKDLRMCASDVELVSPTVGM